MENPSKFFEMFVSWGSVYTVNQHKWSRFDPAVNLEVQPSDDFGLQPRNSALFNTMGLAF